MITQRTPGIYGLFNVIDRQLHRAKRKLVAKVVSDQSIRKFEPTLLAEVDVFLHKLHHHATVDDGDAGVNMSMLFSHLTMDVMGHLAFAHPLSLQTETRFRFMIQGSAAANYYLNIAMQLSFLASLHILSYRWIRALLRGQNYFEALDQMIKTQLEKSDKSKQDLLFMTDTMRVNEDTEQAVKEIRSEAIFFLTAGSDTTTITLSALFFYLAQSPAAYQRLTQEVRSAFAQEEDIRSSPELSGCIFLRACIDEALRMNPPLPGTLWRQQVASASKTEPLVIDGHLIPAGTEVGVNAYALHHNEEYFPDPFTFHPERWLAEAGEGAANRSAFIPFSIGARSCAGKSMAYTEISLIVAKTLWHFDFELAAGGAGTLASSNWAGDPKDSRSPLQGDAVFPMLDHFTAAQDGPFLRFRQRKGLPCTR
ncbi:cytochrome P450 [Stachybotrys elegans]|uniref:Cytochrome P450 n=1 Tax=Stachybotrys elegans TaxID=80388 RepID=A0A8K0SMR1_9HYPO|nr:cytochrome P450 [Stachybotrys elegans]